MSINDYINMVVTYVETKWTWILIGICVFFLYLLFMGVKGCIEG